VECRCGRQKSQFSTNIWLLDRWLVEWNFSVDVRLPHISETCLSPRVNRKILATWLFALRRCVQIPSLCLWRANISAQSWQNVKLPRADFVVVAVCFWQSLLTRPVVTFQWLAVFGCGLMLDVLCCELLLWRHWMRTCLLIYCDVQFCIGSIFSCQWRRKFSKHPVGYRCVLAKNCLE